MAAGATYEPIQTFTLSTTASSQSFSSIPATYTDLVLIIAPKGTAALQMRLKINDDAAANYGTTGMSGNGTITESWRSTGLGYINMDYYNSVTTNGGYCQVNFMNYANTTTFKTCLIRSGEASTAAMANVGNWRSTSAINKITVTTSTSTFAAGSTFTLYGIAAA